MKGFIFKDKTKGHIYSKKQEIERMVKLGFQIPLEEIYSERELDQVKVTAHAVDSYIRRNSKMHPLKAEMTIFNYLFKDAKIIGVGKEGRFQVHADGLILVMDEKKIYTVYKSDGLDRDNKTTYKSRQQSVINKYKQQSMSITNKLATI